MKTISIYHLSGGVLFSHECEGNTLAITLQKAVDSDVSLHYANLRNADLRNADLSNANLRYADLRNAKYLDKIISKIILFNNIYKYQCGAIITIDGESYVKLGCYLRSVKEWEDDFWNNHCEFPNHDSVASKLRVLAFETCKRWLEINQNTK